MALFRRCFCIFLGLALVFNLFLSSTAMAVSIDSSKKLAYAAADITPPSVYSTTPADGSNEISRYPTITIKFSETLQQTPLSGITLRDIYGNNRSVSSRISGDSVIINPDSYLNYGTRYIITIPSDSVKDLAGNFLSGNYIMSFTTEIERTPPTITYPAPVNGSYNVIIGNPISIKFSEDIQKGDYFNSISLKDLNNNDIAITPSISKDILTLNPKVLLSYDTGYNVSIPSGAVKDMSGNSYQYGQTVYFRTAQIRTTPEITQIYPWPGQNNIPDNETIKVTFNMEIEKGDVFSEITIKDSKGNKITYTAATSGRELTLKPSGKYGSGEEYSVTIPYGAVRDKATKKLINTQARSFTFKTMLENVAPKVKEPTKPAKGAKDVALDAPIIIQFDEDIEQGSYYYYNNIIIRDEYGRHPSFNTDIKDNILTIRSVSNLNPNTIYSVTLLPGTVKDAAGNLSEEYTFVFRTGQDKTQEQVFPEVIYTSPGNEFKYISINAPITLEFNQGIQVIEGNKISLRGGNADIPISVEVRSSEIIIKPLNNLNLKYDTKYTVNIPAASVKNSSGSTMKSDYSFSFTTEYEDELPRIRSIKPNNNSKDVDIGEMIRIEYSESIAAGKNLNNITLKDDAGNKIQIYAGIIDGNFLYISPVEPLKTSSKYTVDIPAEAVETKVYFETKYNKKSYSFSFFTGGDRKEPYIKDISPESGAKSATIDGVINIVFSENIEKGSNIDNITLKEVESNKTIGVSYEIKNNILTLKLKDQLNLGYGKQYNVEIPGGSVVDLAGNKFIEGYAFGFTTASQSKLLAVKYTEPQKDKKDVSTKDEIAVVFNDDIKKGYNFDKITLKDDKGSSIIAGLSIELTDLFMDRLVIKPIDPLKNSTIYTVEVPEGSIKDGSGNILRSPYTFSFTTEQEYIPPKLKSTNPKNGASGVSVGSVITIVFDEKIQQGNNFNNLVLKDQMGYIVRSSITITNDQISIKPESSLRAGAYYSIEVPAGAVKDMVGNANSVRYSIDFETQEEKNPPKVVSSSPVNGARNISLNSQIVINYDKSIRNGDKFKNIELKDSKGRKITVSIGISSNNLYIKPKKALESGTVYALTIPGDAIKDSYGNIQKSSYTLRFSTENPIAAKSASVSKDNKTITITLNQNTIKGTNFRKVMLVDSKGNTIRIDAKLSGSKLTITPKEDLAKGTRYVVIVPTGALKDSQFNPTKTDIKINFTSSK